MSFGELSIKILVIEDNEDDIFLIKRILSKARIEPPTQVVTDGKMAIDFLSGDGVYQDRTLHPLPDLIFLDLKLPFIHGFEVLKWIRIQPSLSAIQVIVLTSSLEDNDRAKARKLGAPYLVKPLTWEDLQQSLGAMGPKT